VRGAGLAKAAERKGERRELRVLGVHGW
jgi:hypothetical protein